MEEEQQELIKNAEQWNRCNPNFELSLEHWQEKLKEAKNQGYKSEKCSCSCVFLAFHHYTSCQESDCPFSDGVSVSDRILKD